ncbi:uncharacterized protein LOC100905543 [Galendromus occidentalis]|uniref:Uncharacterized protein LOC100905543 n=1 Tax=Galendromus occidentalis TaxID=34638 RepID=A0AAJ6QW05_9ACAR|nr:uncharacterized protein LOC100905543 [Galendromus occidentalis]
MRVEEVEDVSRVMNNLHLEVFVQPTNPLLPHLTPTVGENPLSWNKLSTIHFIGIQSVTELLSKVRKRIVTQLDSKTLLDISSAIEAIRIPSATLFNNTRRFPEGLYVAWIPALPMVQSLCLLQKLCVAKMPEQPLTCAKLLTVVENIENYIVALNIKGLGVFDRDKFETTVAHWKFNWSQLSYQYEVIEN